MSDPLSVDYLIVGIIFTVVGFVLCFFGYKLFKPLLFLAGFLTGYILTYILCDSVFSLSYPEEEQWKLFLICFAGGVVLGCFVLCLIQVGIFLVGMVAGVMLGFLVLSLIDPHAVINEELLYRWLFISGLSLILGFIAVWFQEPIIILCSAFTGAVLFLAGIDLFVQAGFVETLNAILTSRHLPEEVSDQVWMFVVASPLLGLGGASIQFYMSREKKKKDQELHYIAIPG
eukprot:Lithocolla_globosa_v1_NODE_615_length_3599_cov_28.429740.p2 type:complete len:230 gc:universal NODE_615_length_3599_cov_28.429740:644-1333(+)